MTGQVDAGGPRPRCTSTTRTTKVDVYSFAVVLAEASRKPYAGMDAMQIAFATVYRNKRPTLPPSAPPPLEKLIKACWDTDPKRRPPFSRIIDQLRAIERTTCGVSKSVDRARGTADLRERSHDGGARAAAPSRRACGRRQARGRRAARRARAQRAASTRGARARPTAPAGCAARSRRARARSARPPPSPARRPPPSRRRRRRRRSASRRAARVQAAPPPPRRTPRTTAATSRRRSASRARGKARSGRKRPRAASRALRLAALPHGCIQYRGCGVLRRRSDNHRVSPSV